VLFEPLTLRCGLTLPNRIALAALTNWQSEPDGLLGDAELAFLARRADGGFGLVTTCATYVAEDGKGWRGELGIDRDACIPGLTRLANRIHAGGARAMVQLFHGGARAEQNPLPWSASAWNDGKLAPRAGTVDEIARTIDAFVEAAARVQIAGFDGVELHGAHGYLLSQFLSRTMNLRDDDWGGPLANRARLVRETTQRVRARCGPQFAVGVRISLEDFGQAHGLDLDESLEVCRWLADDGADFIHVSLWDVGRHTAKRPDTHALTLVRDVLPRDVAIFTAGKIWTHEDAEAVLARGADVVALGRSAILNPDWPRDPHVTRPPVTRAQLAERAVSPVFAQYLTNWKNFVSD
jgi:2,4-dienoyl-CoA reductase-like NADH-dependent reductase (Old Yellow Enzyme family)